MKKSLSIAALALVALTGCSSGSSGSDPGGSAQDASAHSTYQGVTNWDGADENGAAFRVTANVAAPSGVDEARKLMKKSGTPLHFIAVTVDNIHGKEPVSAGSASFTTPEGDLVEYTMVGDYLNDYEAAKSESGDAENRVIEVHNAFTSDDYDVVAGQKKTVVLASDHDYPHDVTHATVNGTTSLAPSETSAETDKVTGAPEPSESVGSNDKLADLNGTTLKGNDINFRIFSPNAQKDLNASMPAQLKGAWGALCSNAATEEQLKETGAAANGHNWRPFQYAVSESGVGSLSSGAEYKEYEVSSLAEMSHGGVCAVIQSPDESAAAETRAATVGHYLGNDTLESTVEVK